MRYTPSGVPVTDFSVATTEYISKSLPNGERECPQGWKESYNGKGYEVTTWWNVTCWRGLAETVNQYVEKGRQVYVEGIVKGEASDGKLNPRVWTGNDGNARASFELTAKTVKFLGSKGDAEVEEEEEDDLPF
jgi:single-strand DNA-binding protein